MTKEVPIKIKQNIKEKGVNAIEAVCNGEKGTGKGHKVMSEHITPPIHHGYGETSPITDKEKKIIYEASKEHVKKKPLHRVVIWIFGKK